MGNIGNIKNLESLDFTGLFEFCRCFRELVWETEKNEVAMAEITPEQKETAGFMQNAVWNFRKKYYNPEARQEYWDNMINDSEVLHQRFHNKYVDALILCCVDDFERRYRLENKDRYSFIPDDVLETVYRRIKLNRKKEREGQQ